jgi:hypothetical protein
LSDDVVGAIGRAVADDDPLQRSDALRNDRLYRQLDELRLVASRSDEKVCWEWLHLLVAEKTCYRGNRKEGTSKVFDLIQKEIT